MSTKTENKIHSQDSVSAICVDCKNEFTIDSGDLNLYDKVGLKIPSKCFYCRSKQYFAFWIFGKFRKGTSDLSGESFITVLPTKPRYPVYRKDEWWSDNWDPMSYGQDYSSSRPFFKQLKELQEKIPRPHQTGENSTNCDWCDDIWESKNCYLSRSSLRCENVSYSYRAFDVKDSSDLAICMNMQNSYDCLFCQNSFNLNFSENSKDCVDSYFLFDCRNCQNCFISYNLRNKQYCIRNKQYTKEAYESELDKMGLDSYKSIQVLKNEFENFIKNNVIHREHFNIKTTSSEGNYLTNCDKCINMFTWENSQNCRNCIRGLNTKDCIDQVGTWGTEVSGNNGGVTGGYQIKHSSWSDGRYSEYLDLCVEVEYCFGCVGLKKKKYCILNKQYNKEEYEKLMTKIISDMKKSGEYGEFLPYSLGTCDFNLSTGLIYFPETTRDEILKKEGYWSEEDLSSTDGISSLDLADSINETNANVSTQALICPETRYRFNISVAEYEFHKRKGFALPRSHFDLRTLRKIKKTAIIKNYPYRCFYCKKDIMAYYPPEWGYQKIACEECYKQNIA